MIQGKRRDLDLGSYPLVSLAEAREAAADNRKVARAGGDPTVLAFEFLVLTACRSGDVCGATWDEIDLENEVCAIPGERMKMYRTHRVPLSGGARAILIQSKKLRDRSNLVFPSVTGRPLSDSTISKLVRENGITAVPHGFRSSFRDWCGECFGAPREVAEAALAHAVGGVEGAYARSDLFERRRTLMHAWSDYLGYSPRKMEAPRPSSRSTRRARARGCA